MAATIAMIKNISRMGIVYIFKESEIFLHNELQNWVRHPPLHQPALKSTSLFRFDDLVT